MSGDSSLPVLVGVDGSEDGLRAVAYGARMAMAIGVDLQLVHAVDDAVLAGAWGIVYDPVLLQESGKEAIDEARAHALRIGIDEARVSTSVDMGNPQAVLTKLSERAQALVVGRRALSGLERLFVGSTSFGLANSSHCPVIMVSAATHPEHTGDKGLIGVGVDFNERSMPALEYGFVTAQQRGARLLVIHAFALQSNKPDRAAREKAVHAAAEQFLEPHLEPLRAKYPEVEVQVEIVPNHPVNELTARTATVDLLVLGVHSGLPGFGPGGTVRAVMAHSESPVALVRAHKRQESGDH